MAGVLARVEAAYALRSARTRSGGDGLSWDQFQQFFSFNGVDYPLIQTTMGGLNREKVPASAIGAYKGHGPVFALTMARMRVFSQIRFAWTRFQGSQPGDLFGTEELSVLETPWAGGTTSDLLARMEMHDSLAGNAYVRRTSPGQLNILRPDFVTIILGSQENADNPADAADVTVAGYLYTPAGGRPQIFLPSEIAHFAPIPDPWFHFLGQSWITPVLQELQGDQAATEHKIRFFENAATPNLAIKFDPSVGIDAVKAFKELLEEGHEGIRNAWKTLFLGGGADPVTVGSNFKEMDYAVIQGRAESRLASAAGVPPSWVGFEEGLQGSALNAGNFGAARKMFSDSTLVHLWGNAASSLQPIVRPPDSHASLWYDSRIPFMREDAGDAAAIQQQQASTITALIRDGFTPESAIKAVTNNDWSLLEHSGLVSVQLWEPGTESPAHPVQGADSPAAPAGPPALPAPPAAAKPAAIAAAPAPAATSGRALSGYAPGTIGAGSGMISLDLPEGTVPPVPGGLTDHHITVVYLGDDVDDEAFAQACERAQATATAADGPVSGTVGGLGVFAPPDGKMPVFAHADLPGAQDVRSQLEDLSASEHPDWVPHVTLCFADPGDPLPDPVPTTPVTFTHLSVHRGADVQRFPFGGAAATPG